MIKVYFQSIAGSNSELIAIFKSESDYEKVSEILSQMATEQRCFITETVVEDIKEMSVALSDGIDELELQLNVLDEETGKATLIEQLTHLRDLEKLIDEIL